MLLASRAVAAAAAVGSWAARRVCHLQQSSQHAVRVAPCRQIHGSSSQNNQHTGVIYQPSKHTSRAARFVVACASDSTTVELEVKVEGMKCGGCSSRVEATLKAMDHVKGVQVDLDTKLATVEVEAPNLIDAMNMLPSFVKAIKELGFEAEPHIEYQA